MSQHDLHDTEIKCHVCNGAGYELRIVGYETIERKCGACNGTGLTELGRTMQEFGDKFRDVFICPKCDRPMVHYRLRGYKCPYCDDKD